MRTSVREAPTRIILNASSTTSPDSVCGRVSTLGDARFWRFGDVLTSAINKPPFNG